MKPRPNRNVPRPLRQLDDVVILVKPAHQQYNKLAQWKQGIYLPGVVDWVCPSGTGAMEIRISRINCAFMRPDSQGDNFYIRVESGREDCYNFRDVSVVRRVSAKQYELAYQ